MYYEELFGRSVITGSTAGRKAHATYGIYEDHKHGELFPAISPVCCSTEQGNQE